MAKPTTRGRVTLICSMLLIILVSDGVTAVLDDTCGLPLLKAHFACQDILNGMEAGTIGVGAGQAALVAPTGLPGNASCCEALAQVFSTEWQTVCACQEDMVRHTTQQPVNAMRRLASLASATCAPETDAAEPWAWSACSLGNDTSASQPAGVVGAQGIAVVAGPFKKKGLGRRTSWKRLVAAYNTTSARNNGGGGATPSRGGSVTCNSNCGGGGCFPGSSTVTLMSGKRRLMSQLAIGDQVLVLDAASGEMRYEEVYLFGHQLPDVVASFFEATLANGQVLTLTPDHFVPAVPLGRAAAFKNTVMVRARDVAVGMHVFSVGDDTGMVSAHAVEHVRLVLQKGLYNPYTMGGLIVVDDVLASAHSGWVFDGLMDALALTHLIPAFYQTLFAPLRLLHRVIGPAHMSSIAPTFTDFGLALAEVDLHTVASMLGMGGCVLLGSAVGGASAYYAQ